MSTQNERDMFIELFPLAIDMATGNMKVAYMVAFDAFKAARASLLSRIAEMNQALIELTDGIKSRDKEIYNLTKKVEDQTSRIDALSKDAGRLDWMILNSATVLHANDGEFCCVEWGMHETKFYETGREAIDAAISAREGE